MPSSTSLSYSFSFVWQLSLEGSGRLERWLVKCSSSKCENLILDLHNPHKKSGKAVCDCSSSSGEMGGRPADRQTQVYWAAWWCSRPMTNLVPNTHTCTWHYKDTPVHMRTSHTTTHNHTERDSGVHRIRRAATPRSSVQLCYSLL